jgi:hypothetical protein
MVAERERLVTLVEEEHRKVIDCVKADHKKRLTCSNGTTSNPRG